MEEDTLKLLRPRITPDAAPYWEGLRNNELRYQTCDSCHKVVFHPRFVCPYCLSSKLSWQKSKGKGKIYTFSTVYRAPFPGLQDKTPYTLGMIEMDEGFVIFSQFVECDPDAIRIGTPVEIVFSKLTEEITLPKFRPV